MGELCSAIIFNGANDAWQPVRSCSHPDFASIVERARHAHPALIDRPPDRLSSAAEIEQVQRELGSRVPADRVWFVERTAG